MAITCDRNKQFNRRELRSPKNRINLKQKKKKKSQQSLMLLKFCLLDFLLRKSRSKDLE